MNTAARRAPQLGVAVFAYNEERWIGAALDRLSAMRSEAEFEAHVLVNGCTDRIEAIVRARAAAAEWIRPVLIPLADKANAWNVYVHETAPLAASAHVFTDGDVRLRPGALAALARRLDEVSSADGCAGVPGTGRSDPSLRRRIAEWGEMYSDLYALRGSFVAELRRRGIRLPFGLIDNDGVVAMLVKTGMDPRRPPDLSRITWADDAVYEFQSLSPFSLRDWRLYWNRRRSYALRRQQGEMLWSLLQERGLEAMPAHVADLYRQRGQSMMPRGRGIDRLFDWEARRRIRRDMARVGTVRNGGERPVPRVKVLRLDPLRHARPCARIAAADGSRCPAVPVRPEWTQVPLARLVFRGAGAAAPRGRPLDGCDPS